MCKDERDVNPPEPRDSYEPDYDAINEDNLVKTNKKNKRRENKMKFKFKPEDVDYVYIDTSDLKFMVVKKKDDGVDITVSADSIELSSLAIDELIDDATKHIMGGKEVEVLDEDVITFKFIGEDNE